MRARAPAYTKDDGEGVSVVAEGGPGEAQRERRDGHRAVCFWFIDIRDPHYLII